MKNTILATLLVGSFLLEATGCSRPSPSKSTEKEAVSAAPAPLATELVRPIVTDPAPLLNEIEDDEPPSELASTGDLVRVSKSLPPLAWHAAFEGLPLARSGPMVELVRTGGTRLFGFVSDLGEEVRAPTSEALCKVLLPDAGTFDATRCAAYMRRVRRADGAIIAYAVYGVGPCQVLILRDDRIRSIDVPGVATGELRLVEGKTLLVLDTRWNRAEGTWTGSDLVVVDVTGDAPSVVQTIPLDEIDARGAERVINQLVKRTIQGSAVHVVGARREIERSGGKELSNVRVDQTVRLLPQK